jgi:type I restriction enzyme S subunit
MKDWPSVALGDIFEIARGGSPRPIQNFLTEEPDGVNWVMIGDASDSSKYITHTKKRILKTGVKNSRMVYPGDFLLTNSMSFGHPYIMKTSGCIHDGWLVLSNKKGVIDQDYFYHLLGSDLIYAEFSRLASGSTVKNLNIEIVKGIKVSLPPLEEQRRIAAILDKADGVRRKRKEAIRLTEELLKSTFLEMFGDPVTNPKGWEIVKLGSLVVGQLNNGIFKKNHEYGGDTPVVWVKELFSGYTIDCSESRTLTPTDEEVKKFGLTKGDILFCRSSLNREGIGFNNVFDGMDFSALFECHIIRVSLNQRKVNSIFLNYLLRFPGLRKQIIAKANTVTMSTIGQSEIKKIEFYLPPKELQDKFEIFLRKIATNRTKLENKESENLFNSLLQRAFRGEL